MESGLLFAAGKIFVGLLITPIFIRFSCRGGAGEEIHIEKKIPYFPYPVNYPPWLTVWVRSKVRNLNGQTNGKVQERISEARICLVVSKMVLFPPSNLAHFLCFTYLVVLREQ